MNNITIDKVSLGQYHKSYILDKGLSTERKDLGNTYHSREIDTDKRDKVFNNKVFSNFKKYDINGEYKVNGIQEKDNLVIKGDNLFALHLLKKQFTNKIKLIYIDPPYNTGGTLSGGVFSYRNNYAHSEWITFMETRLKLAKELLRDDGFIAMTIDHYELFYLGVLADEIFGRKNRVGIVTIHISARRPVTKFFSHLAEYMIVYAKNSSIANFEKIVIDKNIAAMFNQEDENGRFKWMDFMKKRTHNLRINKPAQYYPIYVSPDLSIITLENKDGYNAVYPIADGKEYTWKCLPDKVLKDNIGDNFRAVKIKGQLHIERKFREQQEWKNIWTDKKYLAEFYGTNVLKEIVGENNFSYPKSLYAVLDTIKIMSSKDDIVLDFFGGSGTTAHAVLEANKEQGYNRQFILCEIVDDSVDIIVRRLKTVIETTDPLFNNDSFVYCEITDTNI
jgi:adenine-specific DNA-methyltransferase